MGHLKTVLKHKKTVLEHCIKCGIFYQGLMHDMSKFSPTEFREGIKYFQGTKSPNEAARAINGYSLAWIHHKGRNRHHFEYWTDYNPETKVMSPVKMPLRFVKEMFCDRVAATKVYKGKDYTPIAPYEYFKNGRAKKAMHPETAALLEKLLIMLYEDGEDKTFRYIKNLKEY